MSLNVCSDKEKIFAFDFSYDSFTPEGEPNHASQETVWNDIGVGVLNNAWLGFNVSLFAYGQTGAGKSHSMMGYPGAEGIVPKACKEIFKRIEENEDGDLTYEVQASMLEIYNEKVRDLFNPKSGGASGLKIREHPKQGPYVVGLTKSAVGDYNTINKVNKKLTKLKWSHLCFQLMEQGTAARTVAATAMNATSSRAHTIFQVYIIPSFYCVRSLSRGRNHLRKLTALVGFR